MSQSSQKTYTYDDLDRLASDGDVAYTYDAAGNRMTRTEDGDTTTYTIGVGDRLASWTGGAYTYDIAGNVTRIERDGSPALDLTWNSQYQLVSVATNGVFAESYEYDALSRRVSPTTLEGTTRHVYDDNWQVIADIDEQGSVVASYVWDDGIDNLLAATVGGATYYPLTDIQGTVWGYVDSQNNVVARWQYDAWGNIISEDIAPSATALSRIRYRIQGREWSAATGLINFRMRWYDAEAGRWLSKDPIGLSGGLNLYAFCGSDSLNQIDFLGMDSEMSAMFWGGVCDFVEGYGKGVAAAIDVVIPFGDPLSIFYTDECGNLEDDIYLVPQGFGAISREAFYSVVALRGVAALSSYKWFRFLNQNRYLRIGKGNIPKGRPFTHGPGQNVPTLRIGNGKPSPFNHFDLRILEH